MESSIVHEDIEGYMASLRKLCCGIVIFCRNDVKWVSRSTLMTNKLQVHSLSYTNVPSHGMSMI